MDSYSLDGITAAIIIDTRRAKKKSVDDTDKDKAKYKYPIKFRITFMRKQLYYSSGIDLMLSEWEIIDDTRKKYLIDQRELIILGFDRIKEHIKDLVKGDGFSLEKLNTRLSRGLKDSLNSAFTDKINRLKQNNRLGSAEYYQTTLNNIEIFLAKDVTFSDVTTDWLTRFEKHLIDLKRSYTTVGMYMRAIRAIMNEGLDQGIISPVQYPFGKGKYKIPEGVGRKMALTIAQIGKVMNYTLVTEVEKRCRDLWFFSYLCNGINLNDMLKLKYGNIENGKIHFYRQKTIQNSRKKKEISAILLPEMEQIITKWGNPERKPDNYIFPFIQDSQTPIDKKRAVHNVVRLINKKMGDIGKALDYGSISTYTARHSFATVLKRSGANIAFISESLGHADLKTTENYLDSFEDDEQIKNAKLLIPK